METYSVFEKIKKEWEFLGDYMVYDDGSTHYSPAWDIDKFAKKVSDQSVLSSMDSENNNDLFDGIIAEENLDQNWNTVVYCRAPYLLMRQGQRTGVDYLVYSCMAEEGEEGYSAIDHSAPHKEFGKDMGMEEWCNHYSFHLLDDGCYEAELDEAWYYGGSHSDGGTRTTEINVDWFNLPYDEFLEKVLTLVGASHYGFTLEELKAKEGLKEFFGFY